MSLGDSDNGIFKVGRNKICKILKFKKIVYLDNDIFLNYEIGKFR